MKTCKYCGTKLNFIGEYKDQYHFHCSYCDMTFNESETCENRKRKKAVPSYYEENYYRSTKELLEIDTISLFYLLRECRKDWYNTYSLLSKMMNLEENEIPNQEAIDAAVKPLYSEYISLTKQKFIIENILIERTGFLPEKITEEFLNNLVIQGKSAEVKPMYIYIKKIKQHNEKYRK